MYDPHHVNMSHLVEVGATVAAHEDVIDDVATTKVGEGSHHYPSRTKRAALETPPKRIYT